MLHLATWAQGNHEEARIFDKLPSMVYAFEPGFDHSVASILYDLSDCAVDQEA